MTSAGSASGAGNGHGECAGNGVARSNFFDSNSEDRRPVLLTTGLKVKLPVVFTLV